MSYNFQKIKGLLTETKCSSGMDNWYWQLKEEFEVINVDFKVRIYFEILYK